MRILHKWQYVLWSYNAILNMSGNDMRCKLNPAAILKWSNSTTLKLGL